MPPNLVRPVDVYRSFLDALNDQDLNAAAGFVDLDRYRENCVAFTPGFVDWSNATLSLQRIWKGLPDLHVDLDHLTGDTAVALAHGTVKATNTGRLYGAPATKKTYTASFFDFVRVENAHIVERVQQVDVLGQMRQLYGRAFGTVAVSAMLWRQ